MHNNKIFKLSKTLLILILIFYGTNVFSQEGSVEVLNCEKQFFNNYQITYGNETFDFEEIQSIRIIEHECSTQDNNINILWFTVNSKDYFISHSEMTCIKKSCGEFDFVITFCDDYTDGSFFLNYKLWHWSEINNLRKCFQKLEKCN